MKFTTILPENYSIDNINWFFVWHSPDANATSEGIAWSPEGKMYRKQVPDDARRRGTGNPVPARMLGAYARYNDEGQHWQWCPMAEFAAAMAGEVDDPTDQSIEIGHLKAHLRLCEKRLRSESVLLDEFAQEVSEVLE